MMIQGTALFAPLEVAQLSPKLQALYMQLPAAYQAFLHEQNGVELEQERLVFWTTIPFDDPQALLPSKTDSIQYFLGLADDLQAYYSIDQIQAEFAANLPQAVLPFARTANGLLCFSTREADAGAVYYLSVFPRDFEYLTNMRATWHRENPDAAHQGEKGLLLLAQDFRSFIEQQIVQAQATPDFGELAEFDVLQYTATTEQTTRMAMIHNVYVLLNGNAPTSAQADLITQTAAQLIDPAFLEQAQEAHTTATLQTAKSAEWAIVERMIDCLMLDAEREERKYHICLFYAEQVGYPLHSVQEMISDYRAAQSWKAQRQAPPLSELLASGRTETLRLIQMLYIIAISDGGDLEPAQDAFLVQHAHTAGLKSEELHYIINRGNKLPLPEPHSKHQSEHWLGEIGQILCLGRPEPEPREYQHALAYCQQIGWNQHDLDQVIAAFYDIQ